MRDQEAGWVRIQREATETITDRQVQEFRATLGDILTERAPLAGLQWCLAPEIYPSSDLGRDSHPKLGLFLPDLGLPRRMWAGGRITYRRAFKQNDTITRRTLISDIHFKKGRSGKLGFVTLEHEYFCNGDPQISEVQNIVYRDDPSPDVRTPPPPQADTWKPLKRLDIQTDSTLLFRYSAMTFNGHRIHYDFDYAVKTEGYEGLVVHGPLQSTWMQILATSLLGRLPEEFSYRGLSPLICNRPAAVEAIISDGAVSLRVRDIEANVVTMAGTAR